MTDIMPRNFEVAEKPTSRALWRPEAVRHQKRVSDSNTGAGAWLIFYECIALLSPTQASFQLLR
jgi:hypothetical protein